MNSLHGIDLGGTKIEGVVVGIDNPLSPVCRVRIDTEAARGYEHILQNIAALVKRLDEESRTAGCLGLGHPGTLDPHTGLIKNSNTLCLNGKPLKADLEALLGRTVHTANDANCFALAEAVFGAARHSTSSFGIIMGTGVGGGIVLNGTVLQGRQGIAGEWGHNVLDPAGERCYCGKRGCVETVISGPAIERFYAARAGTALRLPEIVKLSAAGDPSAVSTIDHLTTWFARALSVVINIVDPEVVVLGGGLSNIAALYTEGARKLQGLVFNDRVTTNLVKNELGDSAGVFGAALLAQGR